MRLSELEAVVESLLFISGEAVTLSAIAQTIEMDKATAKAIIHTLADKYESEKRGIRIVEINGSYQMCTAAECFEYIRNMYKSPNRQGLTQALLETLAIIAYKQPITRAQIEEIRGVSAEHAVSRLVEKKLVCEVGRMDTPGKPIMFGTSNEFLRYFGFKNVSDLPPLKETEESQVQDERNMSQT
ncbi:MAG: SMC-Scp complex subunit ScpB [Anaerotignum sp.]|nr:SMC-Scp complex subunit ScpB [Anaerotignum sp.]